MGILKEKIMNNKISNNIVQNLREYSQMASATGNAICSQAADIIQNLQNIIDELLTKELEIVEVDEFP